VVIDAVDIVPCERGEIPLEWSTTHGFEVDKSRSVSGVQEIPADPWITMQNDRRPRRRVELLAQRSANRRAEVPLAVGKCRRASRVGQERSGGREVAVKVGDGDVEIVEGIMDPSHRVECLGNRARLIEQFEPIEKEQSAPEFVVRSVIDTIRETACRNGLGVEMRQHDELGVDRTAPLTVRCHLGHQVGRSQIDNRVIRILDDQGVNRVDTVAGSSCERCTDRQVSPGSSVHQDTIAA
jgi:hypothetical protein